LAGHPRRLHHGVRALEKVQTIRTQVYLDPVESSRFRGLARVTADYLAVLSKHPCDGRPRAREAHHQIGTIWKRGARAHGPNLATP
jgi:hypothetical protein